MQRQAVEVMRSEAVVSERRACGLVNVHRATCRYRRRRVEDPRLRERLRELAATRRRFGYRRLKILLKREGFAVNHKRVYRLYVEEKLGLRRKRGRRRMPTAAARVPVQLPVRPDQVWTMDFTQDAFASGRKFRTLNLMDGFTRYAPRIEVDTSLPGQRVVRVLEELKRRGRKPEAIVIDNGTRVYQSGDGSMGLRESGAAALHHARTAHGERLHRELQRQVPRRVSERELVPRSGRRAGEDRDLAVRLQPSAAALGARLSHTSGVCKIVGGDGAVEKTRAGPAWKTLRVSHFPTASTAARR